MCNGLWCILQGTAADAGCYQSSPFTRIATPTVSVLGKSSTATQQSAQPTPQCTVNQQHTQQQQPFSSVHLQEHQQRAVSHSSPAHSLRTATQSPSRIPAAPAEPPGSSTGHASSSSLPTSHSTPAAVHCTASSSKASPATTATTQQSAVALPALASPASKHRGPQAVQKLQKRESGKNSAAPSSPSAGSSNIGNTQPQHIAHSNSSREPDGCSPLRVSTPCRAATAGTSCHGPASPGCSKHLQSPRRTTGGSSSRAAGHHSSNNSAGVHLHHSVAALLAPATALPPAMQQHKDRRRAELYALSTILARWVELRYVCCWIPNMCACAHAVAHRHQGHAICCM